MVAFAVTDTYSVCPSAFRPSCQWFWARLTSWHFWNFKILSVVWLVLVLGLTLGVSGDRLHGLSALRLALLS